MGIVRHVGVGDFLYGRAAVMVPIAMMVGIGGYFWLPSEPPLWLAAAALASASLLGWTALRRSGLAGGVLLLLAMVLVGVGAAVFRTHWVAAPVVTEAKEPRVIYGRLVAVDRGGSRPKILLDRLWVAGLAPEETPERIRLSTSGDIPAVGSRLRVYAVLRPPGPPVAPGAFDYRRYTYFQRIGAVGWTLGEPRLDDAAETSAAESARAAIGRLRDSLSQRIQDRIGGSGGAIAAALLVGDRSGIPGPDLDVIRASGLAHLLAISGLHMALVIMAIMVTLRVGIVRLPGIGERFPTKKVAAVLAFVAGAGYLMLAGAPVSTQRAFIMAGLVLIAILLDRRAISLRLVALAAVVVLLLAPESLVQPGFQMSFAATLALVAAYERYGRRMTTVSGSAGGPAAAALRGIATYALGLAFSSIVAILATAPIAAWHFHHVPLYGLPANMLAVPIVGLWIMPLGLLALTLMPLGLEGPFLDLMGLGIGLVLDVAWWIGGRPDAAVPVPAAPAESLILWCVAGGIFLLVRATTRLARAAASGAAVLAISVAAWIAATPAPPDALVAGDARLAGLRMGEGYHLTSHRIGRFTAERWRERAGAPDSFKLPEREGVYSDLEGTLDCQASRCRLERAGRIIDLVRHGSGLRRACREADAVIALMDVRISCEGPLLIDRPMLDELGAVGLWIDPDGVRADWVNRRVGDRPWTY